MQIPNALKALFSNDTDDLTGLMRHEERKIRRRPHVAPQEFDPALERLKYEILRSSV